VVVPESATPCGEPTKDQTCLSSPDFALSDTVSIMTMSLEQLRSFVTVAEELHFGRAAARLRMTQPPLSRQIQKLERAVGVRLLDRDNRGVRLTAAGEAFLPNVRHLLALAEMAPDAARRVASGKAGHLALGFTATAALGLLGTLLNECEELLPGVEMELSEHVSGEQEALLREDRLDLALMRFTPAGAEFASRVIHVEKLIAAIPESHPLACESSPLALSRLEGESVINYSRTEAQYFADLVANLTAGIRVRSQQRVAQVLSMCALVAEGRGLALVPESTTAIRMSGVTFRELEEMPGNAVLLRAVWKLDSTNPALHYLLKSLPMLRPLSGIGE